MTKANEPAFPIFNETGGLALHLEEQARARTFGCGLTKREYAAIRLRVPNSGDAEIDAMIRGAERRDFAAMAMQGLLSNRDRDDTAKGFAASSIAIADYLIAELAEDNPEDVAAPDDGWIEWSGGQRPVGDPRQNVKFLRRDMAIREEDAGNLQWEHAGEDCDIIRYCIVKGGEA